MIVVIDGLIRPKGRPRFARHGEYVKTYTPKTTKDCERYIQEEYLRQTRQRKPFEEAVIVTIEFNYAPPKGSSKQQALAMLKGRVKRTKKPDIDNLEKTVLDALNGVAWVDDRQIVDLRATKRYSTRDFTVISVEEIKPC